MDDFKKAGYWQFTNAHWFRGVKEKAIFVSGYRSESVCRDAPQNVPKVVDMGNVCLAMINGTIRYFDNKKVAIGIKEGCWDIKTCNSNLITEQIGFFAIFVVPLYENLDIAMIRAKEEIDIAVSISVIQFGTHLVYEHLFENIHKMDENGKESITGYSEVIKNVFPAGKVFVDDRDLQDLNRIGKHLINVDDAQKARIRLAARWHYKGLKEINPVDEFLCYWIAIEILAMPNTNIRPLIKKLATLYTITEDEISSRLNLGRLFDLRGKIVHGGYRGGIHHYIVDCVRSIFLDLFQADVGIMIRKECEKYIKEGKIGDLVKETVANIGC